MTISPEAVPYLRTLRRIPADVVLAMATREVDMRNGEACICGWAIREMALREFGGDTGVYDGVAECGNRFGGDYWDWSAIYAGYGLKSEPLIEEAFLVAFAEAAEGRELVQI